MEQPARAGTPQKVLLIGSFVVRIAGRKHHAFHSERHHLIEEITHALRIRAIEKRCVRGNPETPLNGFTDSLDGQLKAAFLADGEIVMFFISIKMHRKAQVLARLEKMKLFLKQQRVRAEINVLLPRDQPFDDLVDLRMHQRLASGNRNHRRAALLDSFETLFGSHIHFENVGRVLNLAASRARQIAPEQGFEHEHERIPPAPCRALAEHISHNRPHLRYGYAHNPLLSH